MNERIKEIAKEAGIAMIPNSHPISITGLTTDLEKFAELIVRECMAMCKTAVGNADYNTGRLHCLNNIKEHFGVAE